MDSSPLDWGYHLLPCSTTFNQAPLWSLPISSRPSPKLSASIRSCRQARRARLKGALVNYYRLVKPRCLPCQIVQEKWAQFYVHALSSLRNHGRAGPLDETVEAAEGQATSKVQTLRSIMVSNGPSKCLFRKRSRKNPLDQVSRRNHCPTEHIRTDNNKVLLKHLRPIMYKHRPK